MTSAWLLLEVLSSQLATSSAVISETASMRRLLSTVFSMLILRVWALNEAKTVFSAALGF